MVCGAYGGALFLIWVAVLAAREVEPAWLRPLPVAAATSVAWVLATRWWIPKIERWRAADPASWGGIFLRTHFRPWHLKLAILLWGAWMAVGLVSLS